MAWLNLQNRDYSKEIYTSNYDLIFEKSLEEVQIPYFDGFVGSYEPFFCLKMLKLLLKITTLQNRGLDYGKYTVL